MGVRVSVSVCMQGWYGFLNVMEIDSAIFQDLQSFGKGTFFKMAMGNFGFLFGKILQYHKMDKN